MRCPTCNSVLVNVPTDFGTVEMCMMCFGHLATVELMAKLVTPPVWNELLRLATPAKTKTFTCPKCGNNTVSRRFHFPESYADLEMCERCLLLWFNKNEIEEFRNRAQKTLGGENGPQMTRILQDGSEAPAIPISSDSKADLLLARAKIQDLHRKVRDSARFVYDPYRWYD